MSNLKDRISLALLTHPLELALGLGLLANFLKAFVFRDLSPSVADLPALVRVLYTVVSGLGGAGLVVGIIMRSDPTPRPPVSPVALGVAVERAALFVAGSSYGALAVAIVVNNFSRGLGTAIVYAVIAVACFLRAKAIRRTSRAMINTTRERIAHERL